MIMLMLFVLFFFFKQKTAYEMRISDWSSDVCSSDLQPDRVVAVVRIAPQDVGLVVAVEVPNTSNAPHRSVKPCHRLERIGIRRLPDDVGAATGAPPKNVGLGIAIEIAHASNLPDRKSTRLTSSH